MGFLGGGAAGVGYLLAPVSNLPENLVQVGVGRWERLEGEWGARRDRSVDRSMYRLTD